MISEEFPTFLAASAGTGRVPGEQTIESAGAGGSGGEQEEAMRRIVLGMVIAAAFAPALAGAHDVPDGKACRQAKESSVTTYANGSTEADRLAICVKAADMTVLYFGGEMQSEDPRNDGFAGTCGAVIVADESVASGAYGEDWDRRGNSSDFHC